jgi:hypothetical protein
MPDVSIDPVRSSTPTGGSLMGGNLTSGQDWSSLLGSLFGGYQAIKGTANTDAQKAAQVADPYMGQYSQWQDQIKSLMSNPSSFLQDPMFTAPLQLGGESLARQFGASGMGLSGNEDAALQSYGQSQGNAYLQQQLDRLFTLGGVNKGSPAAAGQILSRGQDQQNSNIGSGLSGLGNILGSLLGASPGGLIGQLLSSLGGGGGFSGSSPGGGLGGLFGGDNSGAPPSGITPGNTPGYIGAPTDTSDLPNINPSNPFDDINWTTGDDWLNNVDWGDIGSGWFGGP